MKISCKWLNEYVKTDLQPVEIARILTDCGLEVEAIEEYESVKGGLKGVVIGKVIETIPHPNADKLTCCKVDAGSDHILDIVCGAPNVAAGQKVPVATVGTVINKGDESFVIKAAKLRGELSEGMICAEDELGLGDSHAGIMVLDADATIGLPVAEYFGVITDTILEVAITPNRSDAASHFGVARDLAAAINNREKQHPTTSFIKPSVSDFKVDNDYLHIDVVIGNPEACPRYSGLTLTGLKVQESPQWLKDRLKSVGLRPINNIVDITNFVLMETGQPLHAFDAAKVTGNRIVVQKLPAGTKFITLDETERTLSTDDLMICNASDAMCIGGVFGGLKSGVTNETTSIFLESAYFDPVHIRKTSNLHGLKTDASFRFERGADPNMTLYALKRAALLMKEIAGGSISSKVVDVYHKPLQNRILDVSLSGIEGLIGKKIGSEVIKNILKSLEIEVLTETEEVLTLSIPPFKVDVEREADVVEEVLRIYGYNNVEYNESVHASLSYGPKPDPELVVNTIAGLLTANGFSEIMTNSLTSSGYYEKSGFFPADHFVRIVNPLSRELEVMRQTLLFGGLESVAYNLNRRQNDLKFYEFGNVYTFNPSESQDAAVTKKYSEHKELALIITGKRMAECWYNTPQKADYHLLKSFVFLLLRKAGVEYWKWNTCAADSRLFAEGEIYLANTKQIITLGKLQPSVIKAFDIKQDVYYAEINWQMLFSLIKPEVNEQKEIPRFPEVRRDLALLLDKNVKFADIEALAYNNAGSILKSINLFDVFEGEKIGQDKKSYAVSFILLDESKTLTDKEIEKLMDKLADVFSKELGAIIRK